MSRPLDYTQATQAWSTWGDKLLQHCDRLAEVQTRRRFSPITLQLAPTEACDSDCPFCSVGNRPSGRIPWETLEQGAKAFIALGIKAVELTGGGNPTLYRDAGRDLNDVVDLFYRAGVDVGVITNSERLSKWLGPETLRRVAWVRVSLAKLDEGVKPADYDFAGLPEGKLGLSYIVHAGTTEATMAAIGEVARANPAAKFVRLAADCLTEDSVVIKERLAGYLAKADPRVFLKEIGDNYHAFQGGCWVGMLRPYWTSTGVYICTSHVLQQRTYLPAYRLCGAGEIAEAWMAMNARFMRGEAPYAIDITKCWHCYYYNTNRLLSTVINPLPDRNFA